MQKMKMDKEMKQVVLILSTMTIYSAVSGTTTKLCYFFASSIEGINMSSKPSINCPSLVEMHNKGMGGADLMNQKTAAY